MNFDNFNLQPPIMAGIKALGYIQPTPIQEQSIPIIMQGRDLIGMAQTGTGKTAAFVLPILQRLVNGHRRQLRALVISPTRELAEQTTQAFASLGRRTGLRCAAIYGGVSMGQQTRKVREGAEIVVACPGRLLDHLGKGTVDVSYVEVLVIDEADRMFDMGFLPDVRRILQYLRKPRQTLLFSATMPEDIRKLIREVLHDPVNVQIGFSGPVDSVSHAIYPVKQEMKSPMLLKLLQNMDSKSVLVFTRTKFRAVRVARHLADNGIKATSLQGNLPQNRRQAALDGFRLGAIRVLVATDIAARGIDVSRISHVINYDMPDTVDAYTHRIGRTGRVDKTGEAYTMVTRADAAMLRAIEKVLGKPIERRTLPGFEVADVLAEPVIASPRSSKPHPGRKIPYAFRGKPHRQVRD